MNKFVGILRLMLTEKRCRQVLQRRPEPTAEMDDAANIDAFHAQGAHTGPLLPIYHFNAVHISELAPQGGSILDLGSGSGQFLAYLARLRPDLKINGMDLAPTMVARGEKYLHDEGLADRVRLTVGDMTAFTSNATEPVDVVSSIFSLHHLPTFEMLRQCLHEIQGLVEHYESKIWIFDHARPRCKGTAELFPEVFTPTSPDVFKTDSCNSLIASYSFAELTEALQAADLGEMDHHLSSPLCFYQVHRSHAQPGERNGAAIAESLLKLPKKAHADFNGLSKLFSQIR